MVERRTSHTGWDQEYEYAVEIHEDHLVWCYDIEGGRGGPVFRPLRERQEMADFLAHGPPARWAWFAAEELADLHPRHAVDHHWRIALDRLRQAVRDPEHDSLAWAVHLAEVARIHREILDDEAGWQARLAELGALPAVPPGFRDRLEAWTRRERR